MKKMKTSKRFRIYKELRREMTSTYPAAFPVKGERPPLKVGIIRDIIEDESVQATRNNLRVFLSIWTRSTAYLQSVSKKRPRVALNGEIHSQINKKHAISARETISQRKNRRSSV